MNSKSGSAKTLQIPTTAGSISCSDRLNVSIKPPALQLVERFLDQPATERERILVQLSPDALPRERTRQVSETHSELKLVLDQEAMEGLKRIGEIWSHALSAKGDSNPGHGVVVKRMIEFVLEKIEPKKPEARRSEAEKSKAVDSQVERKAHRIAEQEMTAPESAPCGTPQVQLQKVVTRGFAATKRCNDRYISQPVRRFVLVRDGDRCTFIDPQTGRRCESKHRLELDHLIPFARGGASTTDNLRAACRAHNQRWAIRIFGRRSA